MAKFIVLKSKPDGGIETYSMKEWLRQNLEYVSAGMDPTASISRQILGELKKAMSPLSVVAQT